MRPKREKELSDDTSFGVLDEFNEMGYLGGVSDCTGDFLKGILECEAGTEDDSIRFLNVFDRIARKFLSFKARQIQAEETCSVAYHKAVGRNVL
jgi:hypothetical protein